MEIKIVKTIDELNEIRQCWNDLSSDSVFQAPFYSWYWYNKWWTYLSSDNELYIICVTDNNLLLAIAPLMKVRTSLKGLPAIQISFIDNGISPRNHILYRNNNRSENAVKLILKYLIDNKNEWDLIFFRSVESSSSYLKLLKGISRINIIIERGLRSPFIEIQKDFEIYLSEVFNATQRRARKRGLKKVSREGDYKVEVYKKPDEIGSALNYVFQVSRKSWKGNIKTDMAASLKTKRFYEEITAYFAILGQVHLWILFLNNNAIAADYFLYEGNKIYFLINDFDQDYTRLSPGQALLYHVLEYYHSEKINEFDFGGDDLDYKKKWATGFRQHCNIQIFSKKPYSNFLYLCKTKVLPILQYNSLKIMNRIINSKKHDEVYEEK